MSLSERVKSPHLARAPSDCHGHIDIAVGLRLAEAHLALQVESARDNENPWKDPT